MNVAGSLKIIPGGEAGHSLPFLDFGTKMSVIDAEIPTQRLRLLRPRQQDAERIHACMQDKELPINLGRAPFPYTMADADAFVRLCGVWAEAGDEHAFLIGHATEGVVGCIGLTRKTPTVWEIGYWIGKPWWGLGFATEAGHALLDWGRASLGATGFVSGYIADNPASGRVLVKLGFEPVGQIRQFVTGRACEVDAVRMVLDAPADIALAIPAHQA